MRIGLALAGFLLGNILGRNGGWLYGLLAGFAIGAWLETRKQIAELKSEIDKLKQADNSKSRTAETPAAATTADTTPETPVKTDIPAKPEPQATAANTAAREVSSDGQFSQPAYTPPSSAIALENAINKLKQFFTGGNVMVKVGVTVLFIGVAFLVKYVSEHSMFPAELRLAAVSVLGIAMLVFGWRLREKKTGYALVMQGGALAMLYLTIFSALRLYQLVSPGFAFALLFVFTAFSAMLAVLQNSRALAVLALSGGFLAPVLTSTGSGNYIALFSYYLLLNLAIFGIAWFRSWRLLNVLGFLFTFVIATLWGINNYTADNFATTEPFLIAFYLLYVAIAVLFAMRQPVQLKGYVDSTLVFGVPLVGFALQAGMVQDMPYGLAISSIVLAAFYIGLAAWLWHRLSPASRLLCEAFIAIGVMFATLAIPFALDASWTSGTWALEGAAAIWVGLRQARLLPRLLGYALQLASTVSYFSVYRPYHDEELIFLNASYLGAAMIALCGLFIAWQLFKNKERLHNNKPVLIPQENMLINLFFAWGLLWWVASGVREVSIHIDHRYQAMGFMLLAVFSAAVSQFGKNREQWPLLKIPALALLPGLFVILPYVIFSNYFLFNHFYFLVWFLALFTHGWILKHYDNQADDKVIKYLHRATVWLIVLLLTIEASLQINRLDVVETWPLISIGFVPALLMIALYLFGDRLRWPIQQHREQYQYHALLPVAAFVAVFFVFANLFSNGNASPLPYLPFFNPLDLVLAIQLLVLVYWLRIPLAFETIKKGAWRFSWSKHVIAAAVFLWLNSMWLRLAHHQWDIPFDTGIMLQSQLIQTGIAILWSTTGLACMLYGTRKADRPVWLAGAAVMAAVVIKLFMFDLANSGTVERIVSFISVGLLLLVVGYFSPVPPGQDETIKKDTAHE